MKKDKPLSIAERAKVEGEAYKNADSNPIKTIKKVTLDDYKKAKQHKSGGK
ncbi:hypothetical protein ACFQ4L_10450 [Lapidilactobacillus mulanensis]|uniref:Transcriptional regulator n=1 Tax=Lapidilactobacillus mulanensis TaxID=2485999 RepID=A0ABW4DTG5_9LACO|nr:hypothetical protein [Lapidilactobacillus mulanensis]